MEELTTLNRALTTYLCQKFIMLIIVNKNLIEACALWVLYSFPTSQHIGLDRFLQAKGKN